MEQSYTYEELSKKTVAQLRELASGIQHEAVLGYSQLHKAELLAKLCEALGIPTHAQHQAKGVDKTEIKAQIRKLKAKRDQALESKNSETLHKVRDELKDLKRQLRKAIS